jgi:DNA-binding HxlR family transcriptional regulator
VSGVRGWCSRSVGPPSRVRDQPRSSSIAIGAVNRSGCQAARAASSAGSNLDAGGLALNHTVPFSVGTRATTEYGRARASTGLVRASAARAHAASIQSSAAASHRGSCHGGMPWTGTGAFTSVNSTDCPCRPPDHARPVRVLPEPTCRRELRSRAVWGSSRRRHSPGRRSPSPGAAWRASRQGRRPAASRGGRRSRTELFGRAFRFLGKRWNAQILGQLSEGDAGFRDLSRAIGGISDSVLSDRLAGLARGGLITRTVSEGPPLAVSYQLTGKGQALMPALEQIAVWARDNLPAADC